jgi:hypothetical protein
MRLRDDASASQHAAGASGLVLHALVVLPRPENRFASGQGDAYAFPERVRVFSRERKNIGQEGFDALVHPALALGSLRASSNSDTSSDDLADVADTEDNLFA